MSPDRQPHRGKEANVALYGLHADILRNKEQMRRDREYADEMVSNMQFSAKESTNMRIQGFKKEFAAKLDEIKGGQPADGSQFELDPRDHSLDFTETAMLMHSMGFLQSKPSNEQELQLDDLYTVFKVHKDQPILAENL